jgi:hypothetical protein
MDSEIGVNMGQTEYNVIYETDNGYESTVIEADSILDMYTKLHMELVGLPEGEEITDFEEYRKKLGEYYEEDIDNNWFWAYYSNTDICMNGFAVINIYTGTTILGV